jgi:hypothetical protein
MGIDITTRYHVRRREFLNEDLAYGESVIAVVRDTRGLSAEEERAGNWGSTQLELSDGIDWISIVFEMSNCLERANSLRKINLLAEVINEVREAIELEVESRDARSQILCLDQTVIA